MQYYYFKLMLPAMMFVGHPALFLYLHLRLQEQKFRHLTCAFAHLHNLHIAFTHLQVLIMFDRICVPIVLVGRSGPSSDKYTLIHYTPSPSFRR